MTTLAAALASIASDLVAHKISDDRPILTVSVSFPDYGTRGFVAGYDDETNAKYRRIEAAMLDAGYKIDSAGTEEDSTDDDVREWVAFRPTALRAAVTWLSENVSDEVWARLVGNQTREEFATAAGENGESIEDAWTTYAAWADKNL